jgi:hypothetical protein
VTRRSTAELLALHAVRLLGFAESPALAARFALDPAEVDELLLDHQAYGWVTHSEFAGSGGWSLTERGKAENERRLAAELDDAGGRDAVRAVHQRFLPLNGRLRRACTDWQLRATPQDPLAPNDHGDPDWDARVLDELGAISGELGGLVRSLVQVLGRFAGYDDRFAAALRKAREGEHVFVDGRVDSCHRLWFELHEDLLATLGIERGADVV